MTGLYLRLRKLTTKYLRVGSTTISAISTDGTFDDDSDKMLPTQKAVKTYVDGKASLGHLLEDENSPKLTADLDLNGQAITDDKIQLNGPVEVNGIVGIASVSATSDALSGPSVEVELAVPEGAWVIGCSINNEEAVTDGNGDTYDVKFSHGVTDDIASDVDGTVNVKTVLNGGVGVTEEDSVKVKLTPGDTAFTGGKVKICVVYVTINELPDVM